jgi:hypothetical protein
MDFYEVTRHTLTHGTLADVALGCRDDYDATQEILGLVEAADKGQAWLLAKVKGAPLEFARLR